MSFSLRLRLSEGETTFNDLVRGTVTFKHAELDDFVIVRSDRSPVYHLAVVVDDHDMGITHVIRGDDHLSNTPKQILIHNALGWPIPQYAHVPLISGHDGARLSKRHGATAVEDFREMGILPDALFNYLCLLGWAPGDDREIMSRDEIISRFSIDRIGTGGFIRLDVYAAVHECMSLCPPVSVGAGQPIFADLQQTGLDPFAQTGRHSSALCPLCFPAGLRTAAVTAFRKDRGLVEK